MRKSRAFAVLAAVVAAASSCGNTPVSVAGRNYEVQSAEMLQLYGLPFVYLSDIPDLCSRLRTAYTGSGGCNGTANTTANPYGNLYGNILAIGAYGASDGARLNIIPPSSSYGFAAASGATMSFTSTGATTMTLGAYSGTVTIEQFRVSDRIAGSYDITLENGEREQGHFAARYCDAMERYYQAAQTTRSCSESSGTSSYYRVCSCGGRSATSSCTRNTSGTWTCSCSQAGGGSSSCTMSNAPLEGSDTGTCCSLQL
jgi:hypothetical protein